MLDLTETEKILVFEERRCAEAPTQPKLRGRSYFHSLRGGRTCSIPG